MARTPQRPRGGADAAASRRAPGAAGHVAQRLRLLNELSQRLLQLEQPLDALAPVLSEAQTLLDATWCFHDAHGAVDGTAALDVATARPPDAVRDAWRQVHAREHEPERGAARHRPLILERLHESGERAAADLRRLGVRAAVGVPMLAHGRYFGTLVFASVTREAFDLDEVQWLASLGDLAAAALERQRLRAQLARTEDRLALAVDASALAMWDGNLEAGRAQWSPHFQRLVGVKPHEPHSLEALRQRVHPDDRARFDLRVAQALDPAGDGHYECEFRIVWPDGSVRWLADRGRVFFEGLGAQRRPVRAIGVALDVTERHRADAAARLDSARAAYLLALSDALSPLADAAQVQAVAARLLGEQLGAQRVAYFHVEGDDYVVLRDHVVGVPSIVGRHPVAALGPEVLRALGERQVQRVDDVTQRPAIDAGQLAAHQALRIAAYIGVPLVKGGRFVAGMTVHADRPRAWTDFDVELTVETAERTWAAAERARAEQALRERELRFRNVFELSPSAVVITDAQGRIEDCNPAFRALVGHAAEQLRGSLLETLVEPADRAVHRQQREPRPPGAPQPSDAEHRYGTRDGTVVWVQTACRQEHDTAGRVERLVWSSVDVTARKLTEGALQQSRDRQREIAEAMRLLMETAAQGIVSVDAEGRVVTANAALLRMFGWNADELIGRSIDELVPQSRRAAHARHRAEYARWPRARAMGAALELTAQRRDGGIFPVEVSLNHVTTADGGRTVAFVTDVTERKRAEAELRRSHVALRERALELERRTAQLGRLASELTLAEQRAREQLSRTLHDELQQLLYGARLQIDVLERAAAAGQADAPALAARVRGAIDEALVAARSMSMELFPPALAYGNLPDALAWLARSMAQRYGFTVELALDPQANPRAKDVRALLFESIRELLFNVVKHAGVDRARVELSREPGDRVRITVSDQGRGFDAEAALREAQTGAGLGLFSIRERVMLMGGRIEVEGRPGAGARLTLHAPAG